MADYFDVNGNKLASPEAAQPGEIYRDVNGKVLPFKNSLPSDTTIGRHAVEALPFAGSFAGPGGTLIGTGIAQMMKRAKPEIFGEQPQGVDAAVDAAKELVLNNVLPWGIGKLGRAALATDMMGHGGLSGIAPKMASELSNFPAVREGAVRQLTEQIGKRVFPETGIIEQGAANTSQIFKDTATNRASGIPDPFDRNEVGQKLFDLHGEYSNLVSDPVRTQSYRDIANKTLSDVIHVQNAKLVAGVQFTNDLAVNRLITNASDVTSKTINATKALNELGGKSAEIYKEAMNPASYDSMKELLVTMDKLNKSGEATDTLMKYSNHKLVYSGAGLAIGGLAGHSMAGAALGLGLSSALPITDKMLARIMSNPETAKLVTLALRTPAKAPEATMINKLLTELLPRVIQGEADLAFTPGR